MRIHRINRESPAMLEGMSALLGTSGWQSHVRPRVAWLRQLLPERDPYGPSPTSSEIDDILIRRRQWFAWTHLLGQLGTRWLNDPARAQVAESKVRQLAGAVRAGFDVPRTLLTCSRGEAKAFDRRFGPSVVKSVTTAFWEFSDQSFVFTSEAEGALELDAESWLAQPMFVQERVDGSDDARLFVINGNIVGAQRPRGSLDWRTEPDAAWVPWNPERGTVERAVSYAREFALDYGAFDFILGSRTHRGPVFLECNPAGEFGFLDEVLDGKPSRMLGEFLARLVRNNPGPA